MNKIEEVRKGKGITRRELQNRTGIPYKTLWEFERRNREPKLATLRKIAKALDVTIQEVVW